MRIIVTKENIVLPFKMLLDVEASEVPVFPEVLEETETIPGTNGEKQVSRRYGSSNHILVLRSWPCITREEKDASLYEIRQFMSNSVSKDVQLYYERGDYLYNVRCVGQMEKPREYASWIEFRIPLKAHDPLGYAINERSKSLVGEISNRGNQPAPARLEFKGPATNPSATIDGIVYAYGGTVPSGSTLVVDASRFTAVIKNDSTGAQSNAQTSWNGRFLTISTGVTTNISAINNTESGFSVFWRERWA